MFSIKRPVRFECEKGLKQIPSLMQLTEEAGKIVEDNVDLGYLIEQTDFLEVCNRLKSQNKRVSVMTEQSDVVPQLQGYVDILIAPKRPLYHFAVIDDKHLLIQKRHKEEAPPLKKPWLYCESEFFGEPERYSDIFDSRAEKCERIS